MAIPLPAPGGQITRNLQITTRTLPLPQTIPIHVHQTITPIPLLREVLPRVPEAVILHLREVLREAVIHPRPDLRVAALPVAEAVRAAAPRAAVAVIDKSKLNSTLV
jgi:hypothetical protein